MKYLGVKDCAVVGVKDESYGEIPVAFIESEDDVEINEKELKQYLKSKLANYKLPRKIYFVDNLPKNATGKVLKRVLRENIDKFISNK